MHEDASPGIDLVESTITYTLGANVERLTLMGTKAINGTGNELNNLMNGNEAANMLTGLDGNDSIYGLDGDDTLYGGGGNDRLEGSRGRDAMYGGTGDDTYQVGNGGDSVHENAGEGIDLVEANFTYTLGANVEYLTLVGTAAIKGSGNELKNGLRGNSAANVLDGKAACRRAVRWRGRRHVHRRRGRGRCCVTPEESTRCCPRPALCSPTGTGSRS